MNIKAHLCGIAIAYEPRTLRTTENPDKKTGRPQGSLYGQQKRKIADACEWMRINAEFKPRIFVLTSPGFTSHANESNVISKFTHNLTNGYGCKHFVWVREFTKKGYPHFHFVADVDQFDPIKMSLYWSGLFGSDAKNSIRLGTKPIPGKKRKFWIDSNRMCWYLTKYIGKGIGKKETTPIGKRSFRTFHVTKQLAKLSEPLLYGEEINEILFTGLHQRDWVLSNDQANYYYEQERAPPALYPKQFNWNWTGHGMTYTGLPKKWKTKTTKKNGTV